MPILKKTPRPRLIDDADFLIQRVQEHERKPETAIDSQAHRTWVASLPCHACGALKEHGHVVEAAHLRKGAGQPVMSDKKDDFWCWPGCYRCHELKQHAVGEDSFWERLLGDPDRWRTVLERYGMKSPVQFVRDAATAEFNLRYGRAA